MNTRDLFAKIRGRLFKARCRVFRKNIIVGHNLMIYRKLDVRGPGRIVIGDNCKVYGVRGDFHQYVTLYTHRPDAFIRIGDNVNLFGARISACFAITIGNAALIEESGIADSDFHSIDRGRESPENEVKEKCEVVLGNRVSIGSRSIIMKGVQIGDDTIVGPGSIVTRTLPARVFAIGNPARVLSRTESKGETIIEIR